MPEPDVDLRRPARRAPSWAGNWRVLVAISVGGAIGGLCRYGLGVTLPTRPGGFPGATFIINASGCLLIGVLLVLITEVWTGHPLLRPFLGVGVLGGYTTFSTYVVDVQRLVDAGVVPTALAYLFGTLAAALVAVYAGVSLTRRALATRLRKG